MLFKDADDALPVATISSFVAGGDIRLVENRWVRFGEGPLVSLLEDESLHYFSRAGGGLLAGLSRAAARDILNVYLNEGRDAFMKMAPIRAGRGHRVRSLPDRVSRIELYPSLVEDFRGSGFRYWSPWEGTILVRITPADASQNPVILEMGAKGWAEGITSAEVELVLHETREEEPRDRPRPEALGLARSSRTTRQASTFTAHRRTSFDRPRL